MNINTVIDYLNERRKYDLNTAIYMRIAEWEDWWRGFHQPFHEFNERAGDKLIKREMYTLKMAKKVCEDWAAILLNEETHITVDHKGSDLFLQGEDETGGVFEQNEFWQKGNELIEKAFMSGTGAIVLRLENMKLIGDTIAKDAETEIRLEYLSAGHIIPLTIKRGKIVDVAFVSEVVERGKKHIYIETHMLQGGAYQINNSYYREDNGTLIPEELPEGIIESFSTGTDIPMFTIVSPNIVNNIDSSSGLGIAVYANALDNLKGTDLAYNNFCRDLKLGGKKVFVDASLLKYDEHGNAITPDDVAQQLFVQVTEEQLNENGTPKQIYEYNPSLRAAENKDAIQAQLDYLSFKCGLGTKHYQFNAGSIVTATQYTGDKQEMMQNAAKHYISVGRALKEIVKAILWAGKEILGADTDPKAKITIDFDDSYFIDAETERMRDLQEIRDGLMQPWEYRVKWRGESEDDAKKMTDALVEDDKLMGFGDE